MPKPRKPEAERTRRELEVLILSENARLPFAQLLLNPSDPNPAAVTAARRYIAAEWKGIRNGVPLLPASPGSEKVTPELIRQLDEEPEFEE